MVASLNKDEIESLLLKAEKDDKLKAAIKEIEEKTFKNEVGLYDFLFKVLRVYASHMYFWQAKMPTRTTIRNKLEELIKQTTKLIEVFPNPDEMIILENEYGKTDYFDSKRNFSSRKKELEQDLLIYNCILDNIPSTKGGQNPKPSYKDIIDLLLPFFYKHKSIYDRTKPYLNKTRYIGDDFTFVMDIIHLMNKIYPAIKLVKDSTIGDYIISLYKAKNNLNT